MAYIVLWILSVCSPRAPETKYDGNLRRPQRSVWSVWSLHRSASPLQAVRAESSSVKLSKFENVWHIDAVDADVHPKSDQSFDALHFIRILTYRDINSNISMESEIDSDVVRSWSFAFAHLGGPVSLKRLMHHESWDLSTSPAREATQEPRLRALVVTHVNNVKVQN